MSGLLKKSLAVGLAGFSSAGSFSFRFPRSSFGVLLVTAETKLGSWACIKGLGFYQVYAVEFVAGTDFVGWMEGSLMHFKLVPWLVH